jgi:hypothetical protein
MIQLQHETDTNENTFSGSIENRFTDDEQVDNLNYNECTLIICHNILKIILLTCKASLQIIFIDYT